MKSSVSGLIVLALLAGCERQAGAPVVAVPPLPAELESILERANGDAVWDGADIGLALRGSTLANLVRSINQLPPERRRVLVELVREVRKLEDTPDYYLEFYDLAANKATGMIEEVYADWTNEGRLNVGARLAVNANVRIHGHAKLPNVGGHIGLGLNAETLITGQLVFKSSEASLVSAAFRLEPSRIDYGFKTAIEDQKKVCPSAHVPCPTWGEPLRWCLKQADCVTLWDYKIPINISDSIAIGGSMIDLPVELQIPGEFLVDSNVGNVPFKRSIALNTTPAVFNADARGMFLKVGVNIQGKPQ
ncbi:hypothetical protein PS3A_19210 [Pseudomonas sp. 3A(2025)]